MAVYPLVDNATKYTALAINSIIAAIKMNIT